MINFSDSVISVSLVAILGGLVLVNYAQGTPDQAVLGEISVIINDLEADLTHAESSPGHIGPDINLVNLLGKAKQTALLGKPGDFTLMPDVRESDKGLWIGGCPIDPQHWALLRMDQSVITQLPEAWTAPSMKVCLDLNGAATPNREGYDVIWLSMSRTSSPHVTLLPVNTTSFPGVR